GLSASSGVWSGQGRLACDTTYRPSARPKLYVPVGSGVKASPEPLFQYPTACRIQQGNVARSRSGTAEERRPVVVESGKFGRNLQGLGFDLLQPGSMKKRS